MTRNMIVRHLERTIVGLRTRRNGGDRSKTSNLSIVEIPAHLQSLPLYQQDEAMALQAQVDVAKRRILNKMSPFPDEPRY